MIIIAKDPNRIQVNNKYTEIHPGQWPEQTCTLRKACQHFVNRYYPSFFSINLTCFWPMALQWSSDKQFTTQLSDQLFNTDHNIHGYLLSFSAHVNQLMLEHCYLLHYINGHEDTKIISVVTVSWVRYITLNTSFHSVWHFDIVSSSSSPVCQPSQQAIAFIYVITVSKCDH